MRGLRGKFSVMHNWYPHPLLSPFFTAFDCSKIQYVIFYLLRKKFEIFFSQTHFIPSGEMKEKYPNYTLTTHHITQ